ncbi:hypothetical protein DZC52_00545 [Wenzhouxiangella sediminis]|uniref:Uncharacterized protein n=1 Tax=Wenzhouxiangella sediminis TaxID=1792836 RepID=A0A3E1KCT7_9GAMM|nr:hypothetical protein DZC52_00545 [Wenzhouxiangella sediminis]
MSVALFFCLAFGGHAASAGSAVSTQGDKSSVHAEARDFVRSLREGPDREGFLTRVESAVELIGADDSPAGLARNQLKADVNDYYEHEWNRRFRALGWLGSHLAVLSVVQEFEKQGDREMKVRFADGTQVTLRVDELLKGLDPRSGLHLQLVVDQATARRADGSLIQS